MNFDTVRNNLSSKRGLLPPRLGNPSAPRSALQLTRPLYFGFLYNLLGLFSELSFELGLRPNGAPLEWTCPLKSLSPPLSWVGAPQNNNTNAQQLNVCVKTSALMDQPRRWHSQDIVDEDPTRTRIDTHIHLLLVLFQQKSCGIFFSLLLCEVQS